MVQVQRLKTKQRFSCKILMRCFVLACILLLFLGQYEETIPDNSISDTPPPSKSTTSSTTSSSSSKLASSSTTNTANTSSKPSISCEYKSLADLKDYEAFPQVSEFPDKNNRRHAYDPPKDKLVTLVCCDTTAGAISVAVHHSWAPLGAARFLEMVKNEYFSSKVALMRCVHNFICQFGIAGDPKLNKKYKSIPDDPNWLKEGPDFRTNKYGARRFARGYLAYAGSGKNSRDVQLILSLKENKMLGGGSPWEVPWGELVGSHSYDTLAKISTVYGEKGPKQGMLGREGSSAHIAELFPDLDYVTSCVVVDSGFMNEKIQI